MKQKAVPHETKPPAPKVSEHFAYALGRTMCPKCMSIMYAHEIEMTIECHNSRCEMAGIKFDLPRIQLSLAEKKPR